MDNETKEYINNVRKEINCNIWAVGSWCCALMYLVMTMIFEPKIIPAIGGILMIALGFYFLGKSTKYKF